MLGVEDRAQTFQATGAPTLRIVVPGGAVAAKGGLVDRGELAEGGKLSRGQLTEGGRKAYAALGGAVAHRPLEGPPLAETPHQRAEAAPDEP